MSVSNGNTVHSIDTGDAEEHHSLNNLVDSGTRIQPRSKQIDVISDVSKWRKHAFNVILPRKLSEHSDTDLRLMLVSLKNTTVAASVHIQRIERELKERGSKTTILG